MRQEYNGHGDRVACVINLLVYIFIIAVIAEEVAKAIAAGKLKKEQEEDEETKSEIGEAYGSFCFFFI